MTFYYFGSKFITWTAKLPVYFIRYSMRYGKVCAKFPQGVNDFISDDIGEISATLNERNHDLQACYFESMFLRDDNTYTNFVLMPSVKIAASKTTESILKKCGIDFSKSADTVDIPPCSIHENHEFMLPFCKTNKHLQEYYGKVMTSGEDSQKAVIEADKSFLSDVENGASYHNTKFHCMGPPFASDADYIEDVWVTRLYYCLKDNMGSQNLQLLPSFQYSRNFGKFQQLISDQEQDKFYLFRAVPDFIILRNNGEDIPPTVHVIPEVVTEVAPDVVEVKTHPATNSTDSRNELSQVAASLHSVAIAKILCDLKDGKNPNEIKGKGLLIVMRRNILSFELKASILNVDFAGLNITWKQVKRDDTEEGLPLKMVCAAIYSL